ncbi:hypothetical protein EBZ70_12615 [bacterium]|nr:hypothetical protein [bacterium]
MSCEIELKFTLLDFLRRLGMSEDDIVVGLFDALQKLTDEGVLIVQRDEGVWVIPGSQIQPADEDGHWIIEVPSAQAENPVEWLANEDDGYEISLGFGDCTTIKHVPEAERKLGATTP